MPLKLFKRGDVYHYRGTLAGRRLRGSTKTTVKTDAADFIFTLESRERKSRVSGPKAVLTFADAVLKYLDAQKQRRFVPPIAAYWKETLVKDITAGAIRQSSLELYPNAANATRNRQVIIPTQAIINHSAELGLCSHIRVKRYKTETKVKTPATLEWIKAFTAATGRRQPHLAALAAFMFLTGARVSEALRVQWDDVDLTARTVKIKDTKTGTERRAHLPTMLVVALANIRRSPNRTVFRYTTKAAADKSWRAAVERAKLEPLSFHCCRHGFATAMLRSGVDIITVAKLGGWKDAQHVFKTYGHANDDPTLTDRITGTNLTHEIFEIEKTVSVSKAS